MKRNKKGFTMAEMLIKAEAVSFSLPAAFTVEAGTYSVTFDFTEEKPTAAFARTGD